MVGVPGEFTTMSGRRMKATIKQALQDAVGGQGETTVLRLIVSVLLFREFGHRTVTLLSLACPTVTRITLPRLKSIRNNGTKELQLSMVLIPWQLINKHSTI